MAFWDPFEKDRKNILPALTKAIFASDADSTSVKNKKQDLPKLNSDRSNVIDVYEEMETPSLFSKMADTIASKMTGQKVDRITKSDLLNDYTVAKERQISDALKNYTGNADIPMLAGTYANQTLHPIQYDKAMNEIAPYLEQNGITTDQLAKYYATQALREQNRQMQNTAADNAAGNTLLSFATNQIGNLATGAGALESLLTGQPLGSNPVVNEYGKLTPTIRGTIREDIKENADTKLGGSIGAGAYDVATGIGDQLMSLALTGGSKMGTLGLMSYGAGASNLNEQLGKDTSDAQKLATAVTSGVIEGLTEYLPLDNLFRLAKGGAGSTVRQIVRGVVGQMLSEAGEEAVSEVANTISDNIINGAQSDYSQNVNAYMAQGLSQEDANKQAIKDVAGNAIYSAVIGGISGGIMGGGAIAMNALGNRGNGNGGIQNNMIPAVEQVREQTQAESPEAQTVPELSRSGVEAENDVQRNSKLTEGVNINESLNNQLKEGMSSQSDNVPTMDSIAKNMLQSIKKRANQFLFEAMQNKGKTKEPYNQVALGNVPGSIINMVKQASGNTLDISGKRFAIEGGKLYHEIMNHSDPKIEASRDQIALDPSDISSIIDTMYNPDMVENVSNAPKKSLRKNFALIKKAEGYIVLVEAVGGKKNPNIIPESILHLTDHKMSKFLDGQMSIADILYENEEKQGTEESNSLDIKNRVTVAHDAQATSSPPAYTSETSRHSPLFDSSLNQNTENVNVENQTQPTQTMVDTENVEQNANEKPLIFELTGQPVSQQFADLLRRLESKDELTKEDETLYNNVPEIINANKRVVAGHSINDQSPRMDQLRKEAFDGMMNFGSATLDDNGKTVYNGIVNKGNRADLIFGLSGSGKSSTLVDPISFQHKSRLIDSDEAKKFFQEYYDNGWGSGYVHLDSKKVVSKVLAEIFSHEGPKDNIVIPKVGDVYDDMLDLIKQLKMEGYKVYIHFNDLPPSKAAARNFKRFATDKRFVDLIKTSFYYGNKPANVFDQLVKEGVADGYSKVSNDVDLGKDPIFLGGTEDIPSYYRDFKAGGRSVYENSSGGTGSTGEAINRGNEEASGVRNDKIEPPSGGSGITSEQNVSAESQSSNGIRPEASQAAYNTLGRNTEQFQSTGAQRWLTEGINQGLYDKKNAMNSFGQDVLSNEMVDTMAEDLIAEDPEKLEEAIRNGEATYNPVVWQAANNLMERAWDAGNTEKARYYSMKVQSALTTPARIMQLASRKAKSTFASAVADTQALINKTNENYFKTKQGQVIHDGCQTLAKALKNIGNDYTQLKGKSIPSLNETRRGVEAELNKEASNIYKKFSEQDKEYIANLIHNGYSADELQLKLEQKLTTGHWDISDEDLNEVNRLYKLVENEDPESKAYVDNTEAAAAILAKYIPAKTLNEKITMWRYMAMLLNPPTHVRNIGSNVIFGQVLENVSDKVASVVEGVMHKAAPDLVEKTKSFTGSPRALKKACGDYLLNHKWASLTSGSDKFVDLGKGIKRQQKTFAGNNPVSKLGQFLIDFSGNTLQWEDEAAMKTKFKQAMAGFLVENGKGVEVFKSDDARDQELVKRAADYAVRKAQEATFHEKSKFAEGWKSHSEDWKKRGVVGRAISAGMEGTAPFVSTPANILKMGVKYSPAGFFDGMLKIMSDPNLKKSPAAVTEAIESLARGFTGTSIMALGYMLAANGLLRGRGKKDEVQLDKETGKQDYSIKFKLNGEDYNYTLDWAAPFSIPLFIGAELYKARSDAENNNKKDMLFDIADIASAIADPMTEMSMLQGFNNALDAASNYAKGGSTGGQFLANIGYGYASQMIPSLAGKVARTIDDTQRNTYYTGENDGTKGMLEKFYKKSANRIPGLSKTLEPVISAFGEERKNSGETLPGRLFLNFASPGYLSKEKNTALTDELYRLNEETDKAKSTLPKSADSTPYTDQPKLSEGDYTDWAKIYGQNYARMESEAVENERYQALSDDEKVDLLSEVKALANGLSKEEFKDKAQDNQYTYELESGNLKKKSEAYEYKGTDGLIDYLTIRNEINKICKAEDRSETKADRINALDSIEDMSAEDKIQYLKIMDKYTKRGNYVEQFLSPQYAYDWYRVEANGGKTNDEKIYYITKSDLPSLEKKVLISVIKMHDDEIDYHLTTGK